MAWTFEPAHPLDFIDPDRLCIRCGEREIIGKPHSVYVCWLCYEDRCQGCGYVIGSPACQELHNDGSVSE